MICADGNHAAGAVAMVVKGKVYCIWHREIRTGARNKWGFKKPEPAKPVPRTLPGEEKDGVRRQDERDKTRRWQEIPN